MITLQRHRDSTGARDRSSLSRLVPHLLIPLGIVVMVLAVGGDGYYRYLATTACLAYILTSSFNLVFGYGGIFSLASVAFYGIGAYAAVYAENEWGISFWLATPFAVIVAAVLGGAIAAPTGKLRDIFIAIVTLAFAVTVLEVFSKWTAVTGGAAGIYSITPPSIGETKLIGGTVEYLWLTAAVAWLCAELMLRIHRSALGRKLAALRETPNVLPSVGVDAARLRILTFMVSSGLAGLAGSLYAHFQLTIAPEAFGIGRLIDLLLATVIGGAGTFAGPFVGVLVLLGLDEIGIVLGGVQPLIYGAAVILLMTFGRKGVAGWMAVAVAVLRARSGAEHPQEEGGDSECGAIVTKLPQERPDGASKVSLDVSGVTVRFGGVTAVSDMSMSMQPGEVIGLIGPNGAGKTSLLNAICAEVPIASGTITLGHQSLVGLAKEAIRQAGVARTFQTPTLVPDLTLLENVMLGGEVRSKAGFLRQMVHSRASRREDRANQEAAMALLREVGIGKYAHGEARSQPYGVLRLAEIARCLMLDPTVLLLDEPGAGLTEADLDDVVVVLDHLRQQGRSVMVIDHHVGFVARASDRMVVMNEGQILAGGTPDEVMASQAVVDAYLGEVVS